MHIWHIWKPIWARQIWSIGVSLKRSSKMQFKRVGHRSIGHSSQKFQPNFFGRYPHYNYNVKLQSGGRNRFMGLLCWKFLCVIFQPSCIHFSLGRGKIKITFFRACLVDILLYGEVISGIFPWGLKAKFQIPHLRRRLFMINTRQSWAAPLKISFTFFPPHATVFEWNFA